MGRRGHLAAHDALARIGGKKMEKPNNRTAPETDSIPGCCYAMLQPPAWPSLEWRQWWANANADVDVNVNVTTWKWQLPRRQRARQTMSRQTDRQTEKDDVEDEPIHGDEDDDEDVDGNEKIIYPHVSTSACATPTKPHAQTDGQERPWLRSQG
ncbi:GL25158 [Drosophila persimilis]|uniref:GL25158 n=1 Tax=Drosophila persimilis TaxID=7234 RepID=B4GU61_DROPE|nr:GL25158 [Drosophila persimilis]